MQGVIICLVRQSRHHLRSTLDSTFSKKAFWAPKDNFLSFDKCSDVIKDELVFPSTVAGQDQSYVPPRAPALGCSMGLVGALMYVLFKHPLNWEHLFMITEVHRGLFSCLLGSLHYVHFPEKDQGPAQGPKSRMDSRAGHLHHD